MIITCIKKRMFPTILPALQPPPGLRHRGECTFRLAPPRIGRAPCPTRPGDRAQGPDADQQRGSGAATGGGGSRDLDGENSREEIGGFIVGYPIMDGKIMDI